MISSCKAEGSGHPDMKLLILSFAVLVASNFVASEPEPPADSYSTPEKVDTVETNAAPIQTTKPFFDFKNYYLGAFPPTRFPPSNFLSTANFPSYSYPLKSLSYTPLRQGILPPISQIIPPQISQIVPPISQIVPPISQVVPPIFSNPQPVLPLPSPVAPPQSPFPPQFLPTTPKPLLNKFTFPQIRPLNQFSYTFPSLYSFAPSNFFPLQKQPPTPQKESLPQSYGPPSVTPEESEPEGPAETSAAFEPPAASYPYEPALPEEPEPAAPHKPAQEYGPPSSK